MRKLMAKLFWLAVVAAAFFPLNAEAKIAFNHNETLTRDDR
jgi:hypothetical protein